MLTHSEWCPCAICNPREPRELRIKRLEAYIAACKRQLEIQAITRSYAESAIAKYVAELNDLKTNKAQTGRIRQR